ncbi:hypothetical protein [Nostoc sp.]|uniref:hypothetical protein n=1 Tax=Nostoc sp. TaxID=1180 RepID=UPI002FF4EEC6
MNCKRRKGRQRRNNKKRRHAAACRQTSLFEVRIDGRSLEIFLTELYCESRDN